jgi:hypothetical protein
MSALPFQSGWHRTAIVAIGGGVLLALLSVFPSPLAVFDFFDAAPVIEVKQPPPLVMAPMPAADTFDAIAERPLFNTDRKPDPVPPPPEAAKPAITLGDLSQYRLVGTTSDRETQRAVIQKSGGASQTMKPGDQFEGWTIDKIDTDGVAISGGDRKELLTIPKAKNAAQSP